MTQLGDAICKAVGTDPMSVKELENKITALRAARDSWIDRCRKAEAARDSYKTELDELKKKLPSEDSRSLPNPP